MRCIDSSSAITNGERRVAGNSANGGRKKTKKTDVTERFFGAGKRTPARPVDRDTTDRRLGGKSRDGKHADRGGVAGTSRTADPKKSKRIGRPPGQHRRGE